MKAVSILLFLSCAIAKAQVPTLDVGNTSVTFFGSPKFRSPSIQGKKVGETLDYSEIEGRCFWDNEWNPAILILNGGREIKIPKIKLNFYTSEIHYIDSDENELVIPHNLVKKLVFFSIKDTLNARALFENIKGVSSDKKETYFQVLNEGNIQLLKKVVVELRKQEYDPLTGKTDYRFIPEIDYFLRNDGEISQLKGLNKSSLQSIIKLTEESENWLSSHKNKLKNQDDFTEFFAFLNSIKN